MDPYTLLSLAPGASQADINTAYRKASLRCHPDRCPGDSAAAERFKQLTDAKSQLMRQLINGRVGCMTFGSTACAPSPTCKPQEPAVVKKEQTTIQVTFGVRSQGGFKADRQQPCSSSPPRNNDVTENSKSLFSERHTGLFSQSEKSFSNVAEMSEKKSTIEKSKSLFSERHNTGLFPKSERMFSNVAEMSEKKSTTENSKSLFGERHNSLFSKSDNERHNSLFSKSEKLFSNVADRKEKSTPVFEVGLGKLFGNISDVKETKSTPVFEVVLGAPQTRNKRCREEKENDAPMPASMPPKQRGAASGPTATLGNASKGKKAKLEAPIVQNVKAKDPENEGPRLEAAALPRPKQAQKLRTKKMAMLHRRSRPCAQSAQHEAGKVDSCGPGHQPSDRGGEGHDTSDADQHETERVDNAESWWCKGGLSERLAALLLRNVETSLSVPLSARQMLAAMVSGLGSEALNTEPSVLGGTTCLPHPFPRTMLAMVTQSIVAIRTAVQHDAETAAHRAKVATSDSAKTALLTDAVRTTRAELETASAVATQRSASLRAEKSLLAQARDAEKQGGKETSEALQRMEAQQQKQKQAERARAAFAALEADGPPQNTNEANRMLRQVESHMKAAKTSETLMASAQKALLPALNMKPERRTNFDEAALSAAEGCFAEYQQALNATQSCRNRELAELQQNQLRLQADIEEARDRHGTAAEALRDAQDEVAACRTRVSVAQSARQSHMRMLQQLRQEAASLKTELVEIDRVQAAILPLL